MQSSHRGGGPAAFPASYADESLRSVHFTLAKNRAGRRPDGHFQNGWLLSPRSHDPTKPATRPTRSETGNRPTPPSSSGTRLSAELSRLSPITKSLPGGTVISFMLSNMPKTSRLKIVCSRSPG